MTDFIKVENLVFDYIKSEDESTFRAIDDVSFTVEKGSFTAIIGQNGSGKSTLAKNINGAFGAYCRKDLCRRTGFGRSGEYLGSAAESGNGVSEPG